MKVQKKTMRRLHAVAAKLAPAVGAHEMLREMAHSQFGVESLGALSESQAVTLVGELERAVSSVTVVLEDEDGVCSERQVKAICRTAYGGLGWDAKKLGDDVVTVHGKRNLRRLTPSEANKYLQRLNQIKKVKDAR